MKYLFEPHQNDKQIRNINKRFKSFKQMGSGLSLTNEQVADIIKRDLQQGYIEEKTIPSNCCREYKLYRDYLLEEKVRSVSKNIDWFTDRTNPNKKQIMN